MSIVLYMYISPGFRNILYMYISPGFRNMPERWPQVCRLKITFELLRTICFVSITTNLMKCVVKWIPLNTHIVSKTPNPALKRLHRDCPTPTWGTLWMDAASARTGRLLWNQKLKKWSMYVLCTLLHQHLTTFNVREITAAALRGSQL